MVADGEGATKIARGARDRGARRRAGADDRARDRQQQPREDGDLRRGSELGANRRGRGRGARRLDPARWSLYVNGKPGSARERSSCCRKPKRIASSSRRPSTSSCAWASATPRRPAGAAISRATTCASTRATARDARRRIARHLSARADHDRRGRRLRARRRARTTVSRLHRRHRGLRARPRASGDRRRGRGAGAHARAREQSLPSRAGGRRWRASCSRARGWSGVFFCNSGTEANEAAIKLARKWAYRRGERERTTIVACSGSFHGTNARRARGDGQRRVSRRFRAPAGGFRVHAVQRRRRAGRRDRRARRGVHRRAGAGRERRASGDRRVSCARAPTLRRARRAADLRRDSMRHGTDGDASLRSSSSASARTS